MSVTLNDVGITIVTDEVGGWIERNIDLADVTLWSHRAFPGPGLSTLTWPTTYRSPRRIKLNHLIWPATASRWGYGFFLASAENATTISDIAFGADGLGFNSLKLVMDSADPDDPAYEKLQATVYLMPPLPVSALAPGQPFADNDFNTNNPYILYVVDQRYFWWYASTQLLNIPAAGSSWSSLFTKVAGIMPFPATTIQVSTIPTAYLNANPLLNMDYEVLPPMLDALANNCGFRICLDMNSNQIFAQSYDDAYLIRSTADLRTPFRTIRSGNYRYQAIL